MLPSTLGDFIAGPRLNLSNAKMLHALAMVDLQAIHRTTRAAVDGVTPLVWGIRERKTSSEHANQELLPGLFGALRPAIPNPHGVVIAPRDEFLALQNETGMKPSQSSTKHKRFVFAQ